MSEQELSKSNTLLIEALQNLTGKIEELLKSNEELRLSNGYLNAAVNNLTDAIKKQ